MKAFFQTLFLLIGALLLVFIAVVLFTLLTVINMVLVMVISNQSFFPSLIGYLRSSAISIDRYGNYEFRTLWNMTMIKRSAVRYHRFGVFEETISYVLGKNKALGALSRTGKVLCWVLNLIDKNHVEKAVLITETNKYGRNRKPLRCGSGCSAEKY